MKKHQLYILMALFTVSFNIEKQDNYTVKITNTIGQTVYEQSLNNFTGTYSNKIDIASFGKGYICSMFPIPEMKR